MVLDEAHCAEYDARLSCFGGAIAQLGERYNGIVEVIGSIPISSTTYAESSLRPHRLEA